MYGIKRYASCVLLAMAALCVSNISSAQSVFNGTWRLDISKTKFPDKPFIFYTSQGWYHCESCMPPFVVQADGQDHAVSGQPVDTISATIVDPRTIHVVSKKDGKVAFETTATVSPDGKALSVKNISYPPGGQPETFENTSKRMGSLPAGVHATSGNWITTKASGSENGLITTYKVNGDEIAMSMPSGASYAAKLDGSEAPVKNYLGWDTVALKRVDDHTIEETDRFGGQIIWLGKLTVSPNGKTMTVVGTEKPSDRNTTFVATKQ